MSVLAFSSKMDKKVERRFPWLPHIQKKLLESSCGDYEILTLKWLQQNIAEAIQEVEHKSDLKTAKLLLKGIKYLYYHFCRIWTFWNKVSPCFQFTSHMKNAWVHILSSIIKIYLLLSPGKKSIWINQALNVIVRFPGEKNLIYDALLFVHSLNKKYKPAYGAILKILMSKPLFIPVIIDDPAEFLKVYLLVRRLKLLLKNRAEKVQLQMKVSKILAPSSLWDWLLNHDFYVPWTRKGVKKVTLGVNIIRKLCLVGNEPQVEIVETLRKILLPGLCTVRKADQRPHVKNWSRKREYVSATCAYQVSSEDDEEISTRINGVSAQVPSEFKEITANDGKNKRKKRKICVSVPCTDQILSDDDKEEITVNKTKVKSKKLKKKRNKPQKDDEEDINGSGSGMRKSVGKLENVVDSEKNLCDRINHTSDISNFDNGRLVSEKKNKKKQKSLHLTENLRYETGQADLPSQGGSSEFVKLAGEKIKKQRKQKLDKIAKRILKKSNQSIDKDSCLLKDSMEDMEQSAGGRRQPEMESKKKHQKCMSNSDSECEPKSEKRRQRENIVAEKNSDNVNVTSCDHSLLEDVSQTAKTTKRKRRRAKKMGSNSKETELITIESESDAEDSPVIIDEIHVDKPVNNERECLSNSRIVNYDSNSSDDDQSVILREVKHLKKVGLNSSPQKENKDIKTELNSNLEADNVFIIDSKPSPCFSETCANQIEYDTIYDAEQQNASSCEKPDNISDNGEDLNSSVTLTDLQAEDIPAESNSRLKITDCSHISEETQGSCARTSSPFRNDQQETRTSTEQTSTHINSQDCKLENEDNVISSTIAERSGHATQTDKESSLDSAVQTESLDPNQTSDVVVNCIKFDPASQTLMDGNAKIPIQTDSETTPRINISQEVLPVLESHGSPVLDCDRSAQEIEIQNYEHPSIEADERVSVTDTVDFPETTENNAKVNVQSELPFKNNEFSCEVKKEEITEENRVSESSIESAPLSNTSCLKTDEISSPSGAETVSSESVNINSPGRKNLEEIDSSIEADKLVSVTDTVDFPEKTENNAKVNVESELPFKSNELSCEVKKEDISKESRVSKSSIDSPLSNTSCLKTDEISSPSGAETVSSKSVNINSPGRKNLEKVDSSMEADKLVSVTDTVDFLETSYIDTETTENNAKVNIESELPLKNNEFSCEAKKEEIIEESRVSESSIDSPLSNTSCLKTNEISSPNGAETMISESVNINSPGKKNLEKIDSSIEADKLVSVTDTVDFPKASYIDTETTENNAKVNVGSELPFKNNEFSCEVKKEEITEESKVSESSIDSPLGNTPCLKTDEISSPSGAETVSSKSVNINSPGRKNLEKIENNYSIEIKSEAPLENSVSTSLESKISVHLIPTNTSNSFQEIVIKDEKLTSDSSLPNKTTSEVVCVSDSARSFEVEKGRDGTSIDLQSPPQNDSFCDQPKYEVTGLFFDVKSPISKTEVSLHEDSERSPNHHISDDFTAQNLNSEAKSSNVETPNTSAAKVMIESVLNLAEFADCPKKSVRRNINEGDLTSILNGLSVKNLSKLTSSAPHEKPAECLSFLDISAENVGSLDETQSFVCHTPESSKFIQYRDLSSDQDDNRSEDTLSEKKSILKSDVSEYPSDTSNDAEDEESNSSPRDCNSPVSSPDHQNNCETYVVKTECSWDDAITRQRFCQVDDDECDSRSSLDNQTNNYDPNVVKMECSSDNAIIGQRFCKEESNEHDTRSSQDNQTDIFAKSMQLKERLLNPVVNLGVRCDSKSFIDMNSSASADLLGIPKNSCVLPDIKAEDETNESFQSNQTSSTVDPLLAALNETARNVNAIGHSTSDSGKLETGEVNSDIKVEIQTVHKDVKEPSLMADTELTVSGEVQETIELKSEKELSQDNKATGYDKGPKLSTCDSDQLSIKPKREKELSQDHEIAECDKEQELTETQRELFLSLKLRKRPVAAVQTEESMPADKNASMLNQDIPATQHMNLRSRNPSSSSPGKSASAGEDSSVLNQDIPVTQRINLRSRNPSASSSLGKSSLIDEDSSVLNQDIPTTQRMNLRSRNSSMSSSQGKSAPADEDSSVLNQDTPATRCMNLRSRNPSSSSTQEVMKCRSQTVTKRSSKRLKREVNLNLGFDFSELSLNSPKTRRSKLKSSSNENSSDVVKDKSPTSDQGNSCRRLTRASVISSTDDTRIKEQDIDPDGYNLRSRKSVIMPGNLKL